MKRILIFALCAMALASCHLNEATFSRRMEKIYPGSECTYNAAEEQFNWKVGDHCYVGWLTRFGGVGFVPAEDESIIDFEQEQLAPVKANPAVRILYEGSREPIRNFLRDEKLDEEADIYAQLDTIPSGVLYFTTDFEMVCIARYTRWWLLIGGGPDEVSMRTIELYPYDPR